MLENSYRYKNDKTGATLILSAPLHDKQPAHPGETECDWEARERVLARRWLIGAVIWAVVTLGLWAWTVGML